jgi:prenylcysteine oxidase/farnesylcysteine lyase
MTLQWDAYPKLSPTTNFPPVKLARGFYYVNAFEPFVQIFKHVFHLIDLACYRFMSKMETQTVASRNVVDLLLKEEFNSSICPPSIPSDGDPAQNTLFVARPSSNVSDDFVLGFDCSINALT